MAKTESELPNFLQEILHIMKAGEFHEYPDTQPVSDSENLLGDMSDFEKACLTHAKQLYDDIEAQIISGTQQTDPVVRTRSQVFKSVMQIFWGSVAERFPTVPAHAIRSDWKITEHVEKHTAGCDCVRCVLDNGLEGADITVIRVA